MNPKHPLSTITVYRLVASFILAISIYSCANMSRPGGGPRDETPPVFIKSTPVPNALNVSKQKVEIEFDEIIQVDKPSEKVIVSPPQKDMPEIRTSGRKITVILKDSLLPNTTYTIDFSDAIIDNNELQIDGCIHDVCDPGDLGEKFAAFGWDVQRVCGHDIPALIELFGRIKAEAADTARPVCVIARTVKGKGVSFMENQAGWHGKAPKPEELEKALAELSADAE